MLVLRRRPGEEVRIGEDIRVVVLAARDSGVVRLGIDAPSHVRIWREELREALQRENRSAAHASQRPRAGEASERFVFPEGIAGFPHAHAFVLARIPDIPLALLQAEDAPEAALLVSFWDPARLGPVPKLSARLAQKLGGAKPQELRWLLVLNPFADPAWLCANLRAPIAVCARTRRGAQVLLADETRFLRTPWIRKEVLLAKQEPPLLAE